MSTDLEALIWEFRVAMTLQRLGDARPLLDQAMRLAQSSRAPLSTRFMLAVDGATFARFVGDLAGARRLGQTAAETCSDSPIEAYCHAWNDLRQSVVSGQSGPAMSSAHRLLTTAGVSAIGPARPAAAIAELAWVHVTIGMPSQAIELYECACELLLRQGTHPEWAGLYLFEQARVLMAVARACHEKGQGHIGETVSGGAGRAAILWRRAQSALALATAQLRSSPADGKLARSVAAMQALELEGDGHADGALSAMSGLLSGYQEHRMIDPLVWSACEVARLQLQRNEPDAAGQVLAAARAVLPAAGFATSHQTLEFTESLVQRHRGDHRRALHAYQRYSQRMAERHQGTPVALLDGSLVGQAMRLSGSTRKRYFLARPSPRQTSLSDPPASGSAVAKLSAAAPAEALTIREVEIARLAGEGLSNRDIGLMLGVSALTVRNHLSAVFTKLSLNSRRQLAIRGGDEASTVSAASGLSPAGVFPALRKGPGGQAR